jgi:GT2 family glycosyltransferase
MLIAMAVHITPDNDKAWQTLATLKSLRWTVNWDYHRLFVSDNSTDQEAARKIYTEARKHMRFSLIENGENIGTANAINRAWKYRQPGEHCVKMDNDVRIAQPGWCDWMEDVFARDPEIGICGLKRKDLQECPWSDNPWYKSEIMMLPHEMGQRWIVVEKVEHVIGTCQGYSSALLDKIGYLYQGNWPYAFDDGLAAARSTAAGFKNVFLHGFEIDHLDPGGTDYADWKRRVAGDAMSWFNKTRAMYKSGKLDIYYDGGFKK